MVREMTGGCQCGQVRYRVMVDGDGAYLCHCRMCRRATGGVAAALKEVRRADLVWTTGEPDRYDSSPIARRGFCAECGPPLTYEAHGSEWLDLAVGSFDDPSPLHPTSHSGAESLLEAWLDTRALARQRTDESPSLVQRWKEATGHGPE